MLILLKTQLIISCGPPTSLNTTRRPGMRQRADLWVLRFFCSRMLNS